MKITKRTILIALSLVMAISATAFGTIAYLTDRQSVTNTFTYGDVNITLDESKVDENGNPMFPVEGEDDLYVSMDEDGTITVTKGDESADVGEDGKVTIGDTTYEVELDENGGIVVNGKPMGENPRVTENEYKLVPGMSYLKDPTVTVAGGSEKSYVRMKVTFTNYTALNALAAKGGYTDVMAMFIPVTSSEWTQFGTTSIDIVANTVTYEFRYNTAVAPGTEAVVVPALFDEITVPIFVEGEDLEALQTAGGFQIDVTGYAVQAAGFANADEAWVACDDQLGE